MKIMTLMAAAVAAIVSQPAAAVSWPLYSEIEPNNSLETAQYLESGLGGSVRFGAAFVDGVVEGTDAGLFDYFTFDIAPFDVGLSSFSGSVTASGFNVANGSTGQVPLVVLFDEAGKQLNSLYYTSGRRFTIGVGRQEGSSATAYRLAFSAFAVPEPSTWALMLAGFSMVGFAMRRRRVAFA